MELSKQYSPNEIEDKWYKHWMDKKFFKSTPDEREPYTIVIPPPNVTGVLHMGHMLNNTIQDILVRKARMEGKNACWVAGTDHASIATEAKVVAKLKEEGIEKSDLTREEFLKHAWEWKEKHGGIILEQLKKLGASCDWDRTRFTLEDDLYDAVIEVFIDLHKKGLIYRGVRMVNWDPEAQTAVSDEEVIHKEVQSKLYYIQYNIEGNDEKITIATTRPETILGDTAICINPKDKRYTHLKGKKAIVPLINRVIPIIEDEYVDIEFGTGCLKVTPAHDINDYNLGIKHNLEAIDVIEKDGTMSKAAQLYIGEDRFIVKKKIAKELEEKQFLIKTEDLQNKVGYSERTNAVIEPKLSMQWFLKMENLAKPALENVLNDNIKFYPSNIKNSYKHWMENVKDWCISRQLWWGQRIPVWYYGKGANDFVVAKTQEEALELAKQQSNISSLTSSSLSQDEDVLDTWFSSWLWPISVFDGFKDPNNTDINYYYPTNDLVTAPEIMFFWVARMIMAGYEYKKDLPFKNVYYTGIVRDKQGRKMSKSLGNSPDPLDLIKQFGADGVRSGVLFTSPAGNDLPFDEKLCEQGRNFSNKIWNALRLIKSWEVKEGSNADKDFAFEWFEAKLNESITTINDHFNKFRISDALMSIYKLIWDDFCSWYLEMVKPAYQSPIDKASYEKTIDYLERIMQLLHPFMPFLTEEVWHQIKERTDENCIMVSDWPKSTDQNLNILNLFDHIKGITRKINEFIQAKGLVKKDVININLVSTATIHKDFEIGMLSVKKLLKCDVNLKFGKTNNANKNYTPIHLNQFNIYIETPDKSENEIQDEKTRLTEELNYNKGFLKSVSAKLSNESFVNNAPEKVVAIEKQKLADAEEKIKKLEESLAKL